MLCLLATLQVKTMPETKMKCYIIAGPNGAGKTTFAENFQKYYKSLVDAWVTFDNSGEIPEVLEEKHE